MEEGFVPDGQHNGVSQSSWQQGEPEPMKFLGMKVGRTIKFEPNKVVPITTYRCRKCFVLRSYAVE